MPRSAFDRSHTHKLTGQCGLLIPYFVDEVLPGDTISFNSTIFARLLTPTVPAMDNLEVKTEFFFVPNRLVWTNWIKMMGEQASPGDSISYTIPQQSGGAGTSYAIGTLGDYLLADPSKNYGGTAGYCSALPFRCYNKIWNDWFRDENIMTGLTLDVGDGPDTPGNYVLLQRAKKHDYFYSALTQVQKGTAVPLLSGTANVYGPTPTSTTGSMVMQAWNTTDGAVQFGGIGKGAGVTVFDQSGGWTGAAAGDTVRPNTLGSAAQYTSLGAAYSAPYADFTTDAIDTINTLRLAATTQQFLEKDARAGTRYTEICLSHFGVTNPDSRLQRSEYLGGGRAPMNITPIPNTSNTNLGTLGAIGTGMSNNHSFTKSFTEHGHVMGLVTLRVASMSYQQGLRKMWTRQTRYDYYWPVFANLGEQAVYRGEIYYVGDKATTNADNTTVWGYQERWSEYRYYPNKISGQFRSQAATPLDAWHFAQNYGSAPSLNSTFLPDDSATIVDRNLGVTHSATIFQFKMDIYNRYHHARVMPVRSVPGIGRL
jgi:hypothetical protein